MCQWPTALYHKINKKTLSAL